MGAVHGIWCNTRTWPDKCPTCGDDVFFFTCDCGSRVRFDELGPPWPVHDCDTSWTRKLKRTTDKSGKITVQLGTGITVSRSPETFAGIEQAIVIHAKKKKTNDPFIAIEPTDKNSNSIIGILREIHRDVCPFQKYSMEDNAIARALLGPLGKQKMGRITVHVPLPAKAQAESYTLWIPADLIEDCRIVRGISVSLVVESMKVNQHQWVWFSDEFDVVG